MSDADPPAPARRRLLHVLLPPLPRSGAFASFMAGAWAAWLVVFGLTGVLAGVAAGHPVIGGILGAAIGYRPAIHLGTIAHYGAPIGVLGIPFMIVLVVTGKLWLGILFSVLPLAHVLSVRARGSARAGAGQG